MLVIGVDFTVVPSGHAGNSSMYSWTVLAGPLLPLDKLGSAMSLIAEIPCLKGSVGGSSAKTPHRCLALPEARADATGRLISLL
jgi:hypothetical protein